MKKIITTFLICISSFSAIAVELTSSEFKKYEKEYLDITKFEYPISEEKFEPLKKCARRGNYICTFEVGWYYHAHLNDPNNAFKYFEAAAKADHYMANVYLSEMYAHGEGALQDYDKAIYFAQKSISSGKGDFKHTAYNIHIYYLKKPYSRENIIQAYAWLKVYKALGGSTIIYDNGTSEQLTEKIIIKDRNKLNSLEIIKANKLASDICSKIDGCNQ